MSLQNNNKQQNLYTEDLIDQYLIDTIIDYSPKHKEDTYSFHNYIYSPHTIDRYISDRKLYYNFNHGKNIDLSISKLHKQNIKQNNKNKKHHFKTLFFKMKKKLTTKFNIKEGELAYCHNIVDYSSQPLYNHVLDCENQLINSFSEFTIQSFEFDSENLNNQLSKISNLFKENDWSLKLIEDIITLYILIDKALKSDNVNTDILFALTTFTKLRCNSSLLNCIFLQNLVSKYNQIFSNTTNCTEIQSFESTISDMRNLLGKYDSIKDSEFFKKIYKLIMYSMSLSIFDKLGITFTNIGYSTFEAEALKKKYTNRSDLIYTILDTFLFLCERGFQILKTGDYERIFHSANTYSDFHDQYLILKRQSVLLTNPEAHGFKESTFRANLDDSIEKGESIYKHCQKLSNADKRFVSNMLNELLMIRCDLCTKRAAREHRKAPFSVLVFGESGIGKSTIKDIIFNQYAKIKNLENDPSYCYTRNAVANFWDGFTTSQWAIILDDIAAINPNKAPNGDPSMMELIQLINSVPFVPDQADLSNKGRTPVKCELVIATTNVKNLNAYHYFSHPSAVQRRLPWIITPSVKPEFANNDGTLDSNKTHYVEGEYPDYWIWKVEKVSTRKTTDAQKIALTEIILECDSIIEFLKWFNGAVINFDKNQDLVQKSVNSLRNIEICNVCFLPISNCDCNVESAVVYDLIYRFCRNFCIIYIIDYIFRICYLLYFFTVEEILFSFFGHYMWFSLLKFKLEKTIGLRNWMNYQKFRINRIGRKIRDNIGHPAFLLTTASVLVSILSIYKVLNSFKKNSSTSDNIGTKPEPINDERENVWYKNDFQLSEFEISRSTSSSKGLNRDKFVNMISKNLISFKIFTNPGKSISGKATCLKGQLYMTNNHNIPNCDNPLKCEIVSSNCKDGVNSNIMIKLSEKQIYRDERHDLAIFIIPNLPPGKDITPYFALDDIDIKTRGFQLHRQHNGSILQQNLNCISKKGWNVKPTPGFIGEIWSSKIDGGTINGDCGSLMIGETSRGYIILGFHVLASTIMKTVGSININYNDIKDERFMQDFNIQSNVPRISSESVHRELINLHPKSVFRYIDSGSAMVYGSFAGFRPKHKSSVEISPMASFLSNYNYKIKYGPPVMETWEPWHIAAVDMVKPIYDIDYGVVEICKESFLNDIFKEIKDLSTVQVYDDFTTINGALGVSYVDKINRNTSAGNPWKKSKKYFMYSIPEKFGLCDAVDVNQEIKDNVNNIIKDYSEGKRAMPNFCAHLKDEPVSFKKIKMKKTRVFTGAPLDFTIVVRKYLLSTIRLIQNNRTTFESAPGTIAQSLEWEQLYKYITKFGSHRIVAGDYKSFDKKMSPVFVKAAFDILYEICKKSGNYTEEDLLVVKGISQDITFPLVDYNGDLVQFFGTNPSGHPLTVIINGLVNCLYMRYAYYKLNPNKETFSFKDNVALMTYGDDNIMSVSKNIDWYDHTLISKKFSDMGIIYTMADKEAKSIPFVSLEETSFLKRTWRFDDDLKVHLAPLEHESIEKMLMIWCRSKSISAEEQCIAVITSAVREYFFYGKIIFNSKRDMLIKLASSLKLEDWVHENVFPTWDQLVSEFYKNSQHCLNN